MNDQKIFKTKLIAELEELRQRIIKLEHSENECARAKDALSQSESKFRRYIKNNPHGIMVAGENGNCIQVNEAFEKITGYSSGGLLKMNLSDLFESEYQQAATEFFSTVIKSGKASGEFPFIKKDGSQGYGTVDAIRISKNRFLGFVTETTQRKQEEEALRKSQSLYRQAELLGKMGHWEWDYQNKRMVSCSEQFARIYEMNVDEAIEYFSSQEAEYNVIHPDDREWYKQYHDDSMDKPEGLDIEFRIITRSGKVRHIHLLSERILDDQGNVIGAFGTERDITQRLEAEQALRLSEANKTAIVENTLDSIWAINTQYEILYTNQIFSQAFLATFGETLVAGTNLLQSLPESIRPVWKERYKRVFEGERFVFVDEIEAGDVVIHIEVAVNPIVSDGKVIGASFFGRDITERALAEEDARQRALESSILFSVSQMLAQAPPDSNEIALIMARQIVDVLELPAASIALYNAENQTFKFLVDYFKPKAVRSADENWKGKVISISEYPDSVSQLKTMEPYIAQISDPNIEPNTYKYMKKAGVKTEAIFPMAVEGRFVGIIELETWCEEYHYSAREINLAKALANLAAVALERSLLFEKANHEINVRKQAEMELHKANKQLQSQLAEIKELEGSLREQAIRDPLTGQFNRRYMDEALKRELVRASRKGEPLSVVLLDLDYLKNINDEFGHVIGGDVSLKLLANTLKKVCRKEDTLCRYAGDEFLVILYDTPLQVAKERAVEWRKSLKNIPSKLRFGLTFSAGVATFPDHGSTAEEILIQADRALYYAKEQGRDQIVMYGEDIQKYWQDKDA